MSNSKKTVNAYQLLLTYVKRNRYNSTFDTNTIREKLSSAGIEAWQMSGLISSAVRTGVITRVGDTMSNDPYHKSGRVGVYMRGYASYTS